MTVSDARRLDEMKRVLVQMVRLLGDEQLLHRFYVDSDAFSGILPTTWRELIDRQLVERGIESGPVHYRLTPAGWVRGLEQAGLKDDPKILARAQTIVKAIKRLVKEDNRSSHDDAVIDVRVLAERVNLPVTWLFNVFQSNLLQELFPDKMMNAAPYDRAQVLILVPSTFGQRKLP